MGKPLETETKTLSRPGGRANAVNVAVACLARTFRSEEGPFLKTTSQGGGG